MSTIPSPLFYVYVLARPNGKPFYVGKGARRRIYDHEIEARRGHVCHKCNIIRKIWNQGGQVQRYTIFTTTNEQEAFDYECEIIALYGRSNLTNQTDGGEGASGHKLPDHVRRMLIERNTGRKDSIERRNKIATTQTKGRTYTIVSPDGETYPNVINLQAFERDHNLPSVLWHVVRGRVRHYGGWTGWINGQEPRPQPKTYIVIAPDGTRYERIINVNAFAKEHTIDAFQLRSALRGDRPHAHGWIGWVEGQEPIEKPQPPVYDITAPDGTMYCGVNNLAAFARDHTLSHSSLYRVASGQYKQYKGWLITKVKR
jgi:LEM3-like protein